MKHPTEHDKLIKAEKERHDMKIADLANTSKKICSQPTLQEVASKFEHQSTMNLRNRNDLNIIIRF